LTAPSLANASAHLAHAHATRRLLALVRLCFVVAGGAPWILPLLRAWLPLEPIARLLELPFALACHRLPERTIALAGIAMPLCSRCAGIAGGLGLGALVAWPALSLGTARAAAALGAVLVVVDVATQDLGLRPPWHATRLATGALLGYVLGAALVAAIVRERRATSFVRRERRTRTRRRAWRW
jgi:uncharacterized membrane protein